MLLSLAAQKGARVLSATLMTSKCQIMRAGDREEVPQAVHASVHVGLLSIQNEDRCSAAAVEVLGAARSEAPQNEASFRDTLRLNRGGL